MIPSCLPFILLVLTTDLPSSSVSTLSCLLPLSRPSFFSFAFSFVLVLISRGYCLFSSISFFRFFIFSNLSLSCNSCSNFFASLDSFSIIFFSSFSFRSCRISVSVMQTAFQLIPFLFHLDYLSFEGFGSTSTVDAGC